MIISENICLSGGAIGSDLCWGECARKIGHAVVHWSFKGHKSDAPEENIVELTDAQLKEANDLLEKARKRMGRKPANGTLVRNLLRRNYHQINHTERVYAISEIVDESTKGGTGYAVTMYLLRNGMKPCECYVFDQVLKQWFCWKGLWEKIDSPPKPHGVWTGIGVRDINEDGKKAIENLMKEDDDVST